MTRSQLEYLGYKETQRNNLANLAEQKRHSLATETESHRSNLAQENIGKGGLAETKRHNLISERLTKSGYSKDIRVAKLGAKGRTDSARISSQSAKTVASINAQAQRDVANIKATQDALDRAQRLAETTAKNSTQIYTTKLNNETAKTIKQIDALVESNKLSQKEKADLRDVNSKLKIARRRNLTELTKTGIQETGKLLNTAGQIVSKIALK